MRALARWLGALVLMLFGGRRRRLERERTMPPPADDRRAVRAVLALLAGASLASSAFAVVYLVSANTQLLGLSIGVAFACMSAASIIAGKLIVPQEEHEEELSGPSGEAERAATTELVREGGEGISRRGLLIAAAGGAAGVTGTALVLPAASLGPVLDTERLHESPWRPGTPLVDEQGAPVSADAIALGSFVTAFAAGADRKALDASVVVVRLQPEELRLPPERSTWAPEGFVAYSKICTHAACAVSEFDYPTYPPTSPRPRLVCPCHYSAFDAAGGGDVVAGPAGRPLPQLPLELATDRTLRAAGGFSGPPGPSWSGVRT